MASNRTQSLDIFFSKLLLTLSVMAGANALSHIKTHCGQLSVEGYETCKIGHNDEVMSYRGPDLSLFSGLRFGLITYTCDNTSGYIISDFDCTDCGFYCTPAEYELERQQEDVQFWAGVILGVLLSLAVVGIIGKYTLKFLKPMFLNVHPLWHKKTGVNTTSASTTSVDISDDVDEPLSKKWSEVELCDAPDAKNNESKGKRFIPRVKKRFSSLFASLLFIESVNACDWTFLVGVHNLTMVCNQNECQSTPPPSFSVSIGQKVCFEDHLGGVVVLDVNEITLISRYELKYHTSKYIIANISEDTCGPIGSNECQSACHHLTLNELNAETRKNGTTFYHKGSSCNEITIERYSSYRIACCRFLWTAESVGELYPVFTKVVQSWMINLTISQNNNVRQIILDTRSPAFDLTGFKLNTTDKLPFLALNAEVRSTESFNSLILYDEVYYSVLAAEVNKPRHGAIGDFQVEITKNKTIFIPPRQNICSGSFLSHPNHPEDDFNCKCNCKFPESAISKFDNISRKLGNSENVIIRNDQSIIDKFEKFEHGNVSFKLGEWKIEDASVKNAQCDFDYILSYNCPMCDESSYVVLIPRDVKREGPVPFYSDCSFDKTLLQCDLTEPVKLVLKEDYKTCFLKMPTLGQKMLIDVEHKNIRRRLQPKRRMNLKVMSYGESLDHLFSGETFVNAFTNTVIFFAIFFSVIILAFVIFNVIRYKKKLDGGTALILF